MSFFWQLLFLHFGEWNLIEVRLLTVYYYYRVRMLWMFVSIFSETTRVKHVFSNFTIWKLAFYKTQLWVYLVKHWLDSNITVCIIIIVINIIIISLNQKLQKLFYFLRIICTIINSFCLQDEIKRNAKAFILMIIYVMVGSLLFPTSMIYFLLLSECMCKMCICLIHKDV